MVVKNTATLTASTTTVNANDHVHVSTIHTETASSIAVHVATHDVDDTKAGSVETGNVTHPAIVDSPLNSVIVPTTTAIPATSFSNLLEHGNSPVTAQSSVQSSSSIQVCFFGSLSRL